MNRYINRMKYTLITGASKGMGLEMAHVCAAKNEFIASFLPNEGLEKLALSISNEYKLRRIFSKLIWL